LISGKSEARALANAAQAVKRIDGLSNIEAILPFTRRHPLYFKPIMRNRLKTKRDKNNE
jgi:hypothetical protein